MYSLLIRYSVIGSVDDMFALPRPRMKRVVEEDPDQSLEDVHILPQLHGLLRGDARSLIRGQPVNR